MKAATSGSARRRTAPVFVALVGLYGLLLLPGLFFPAYLDSPLGLLAAIPYLSIYLFHALGLPGLLQHDGACGWGWCAPSLAGWVFLLLLWGGLAWLAARGLSSLRPPRD